jgi:hypothetical protein
VLPTPEARPKEAKSLSAEKSSAHPAHPSTEEQDHPHACLDGYVYLGYTDEDGEEQIEKLPCRRCAVAAEEQQ